MILRCSQFCCKDGGGNYFCVGKYMDFTFLLRWFLESFCSNGGGDNVFVVCWQVYGFYISVRKYSELSFVNVERRRYIVFADL